MQAVVTTEQLQARLPFEMDEDELREAAGALEDLSDDARAYGKSIWTGPTTTPRNVCNLVLRAASRHMKNYDGYTQSRAGDETLSWTDRGEAAGSAHFTTKEIATLRALAGNVGSGMHSIPTVAWGNGRPTAAAAQLIRDEHGFLMPIYEPGWGPDR